MANRHSHPADAARARDNEPAAHADLIASAMRQLAGAGPTATGATLVLPDGSIRFISIAEARAWMADRPEGRPQ